MRLRNIPGADAAITESVYCIKSPETHKGHWQEIFPSQQPLHIEIGMGKGRFMMDLAAAHPDINYLGIERYSQRPAARPAKNGRESAPEPVFHLHGRRRCR